MPLDDVDSQGQKNTDALKSVGLLLMSSIEVSCLEQGAYINIAVLCGKCERMSCTTQSTFMIWYRNWKLHCVGDTPYTRRHGNVVLRKITRLDNGQWSSWWYWSSSSLLAANGLGDYFEGCWCVRNVLICVQTIILNNMTVDNIFFIFNFLPCL